MYFKYFKTVLRHKYFVFKECQALGITWRGIVHDLSKFLPSEFYPYTQYFNGKGKWPKWDIAKHQMGYPYRYTEEGVKEAFDNAWLMHQKRNPHHWQYWVLQNDTDGRVALEMPDKYVKEMWADWTGAGIAYTGKRDVLNWYHNNKEKMILHPATEAKIAELAKGEVIVNHLRKVNNK
jgi:hypothetical protein